MFFFFSCFHFKKNIYSETDIVQHLGKLLNGIGNDETTQNSNQLHNGMVQISHYICLIFHIWWSYISDDRLVLFFYIRTLTYDLT